MRTTKQKPEQKKQVDITGRDILMQAEMFINEFISHVEATQGKSRNNCRLRDARSIKKDLKEMIRDEKDGWFDL